MSIQRTVYNDPAAVPAVVRADLGASENSKVRHFQASAKSGCQGVRAGSELCDGSTAATN